MFKYLIIIFFIGFSSLLFSQNETSLKSVDPILLMEGVRSPFLIENYSDSINYHFEYNGLWFERKADTVFISAYADYENWLEIYSIDSNDTILNYHMKFHTVRCPKPIIFWGENDRYFGKSSIPDTLKLAEIDNPFQAKLTP